MSSKDCNPLPPPGTLTVGMCYGNVLQNQSRSTQTINNSEYSKDGEQKPTLTSVPLLPLTWKPSLEKKLQEDSATFYGYRKRKFILKSFKTNTFLCIREGFKVEKKCGMKIPPLGQSFLNV